jgi:hypothetical protein
MNDAEKRQTLADAFREMAKNAQATGTVSFWDLNDIAGQIEGNTALGREILTSVQNHADEQQSSFEATVKNVLADIVKLDLSH